MGPVRHETAAAMEMVVAATGRQAATEAATEAAVAARAAAAILTWDLAETLDPEAAQAGQEGLVDPEAGQAGQAALEAGRAGPVVLAAAVKTVRTSLRRS